IARNHERRAEVAERASEREHRRRRDWPPGEREADAPEQTPFRSPQTAPSTLTRDIDRFERRARRLDHERNGVERRGDNRRFPGEDEGRPCHRFPRLSNPAGAADHDEQVIAEYGGRQSQRQHGGGIESIPPRKIPIGEQPGNPQPKRKGNERRNARDFETEPERKPVDAHRDGYLLWHVRYSTTGTS